MEPISNPFKYEVLKWTGNDDDCHLTAETFLPARCEFGPASKPVHFDKNVFVDGTKSNGFVVKVQTKTFAYHAYEGLQLEPGTYVFTPDFSDFECITR